MNQLIIISTAIVAIISLLSTGAQANPSLMRVSNVSCDIRPEQPLPSVFIRPELEQVEAIRNCIGCYCIDQVVQCDWLTEECRRFPPTIENQKLMLQKNLKAGTANPVEHQQQESSKTASPTTTPSPTKSPTTLKALITSTTPRPPESSSSVQTHGLTPRKWTQEDYDSVDYDAGIPPRPEEIESDEEPVKDEQEGGTDEDVTTTTTVAPTARPTRTTTTTTTTTAQPPMRQVNPIYNNLSIMRTLRKDIKDTSYEEMRQVLRHRYTDEQLDAMARGETTTHSSFTPEYYTEAYETPKPLTRGRLYGTSTSTTSSTTTSPTTTTTTPSPVPIVTTTSRSVSSKTKSKSRKYLEEPRALGVEADKSEPLINYPIVQIIIALSVALLILASVYLSVKIISNCIHITKATSTDTTRTQRPAMRTQFDIDFDI